MRPLFQVPSWDGKIVLAGIFFVGYYFLVWTLTRKGLPAESTNIVRDAMLQLGPPIGVIVGALYRNTAAEERRDVLRSNELQTAIVTPSTVTENGTGNGLENDVRDGAREGARRGVTEGLGGIGENTTTDRERPPPPPQDD